MLIKSGAEDDLEYQESLANQLNDID